MNRLCASVPGSSPDPESAYLPQYRVGLLSLSLFPLGVLPLSVLLSSVFSNLFPAGLLALRCTASPSIESLFIYVTGALALQAAYPLPA